MQRFMFHREMQEKVSRAVSKGIGVAYVESVVGYSIATLRRHLEVQFVRGMTWDNYAGLLPWRHPGRKWHIDHIVPKTAFSVEDVRAAFALSNLRPLWAKDNFIKAARRTHLL